MFTLQQKQANANSKNEIKQLSQEILQLKKDKNAVILAHYYQELAIQNIADRIGDSLALSMEARDVKDAEVIVFAGVYFMAETAKLLNSKKKVLIPNINAGCPLANQCSSETINIAREKYGSNIPVVVYVNTTAQTKAAADVACTSSNATNVIKNLQEPKVLFGPDRNLCSYVQRKLPEIEIIPIPEDGHCYVHTKFNLKKVQALKKKYPEAILIAHPECNIEIQNIADYIGSTSAMLRYAKEATTKTVIIATEKGLVDRLNHDYPTKKFILAEETAICKNMKKITLENLRDALLYEQFEVTIPENIFEKAKKTIVRMFELT